MLQKKIYFEDGNESARVKIRHGAGEKWQEVKSRTVEEERVQQRAQKVRDMSMRTRGCCNCCGLVAAGNPGDFG